jgi:TPP-dependent pyruvate/acetoin dehydrogenase alpha subunit
LVSLDNRELLELYRKLVLVRQAEVKIREEYSKDEMKTPVHLGIGGEAVSIGVCHCLPKGAKAFGTYRNHALFLTLTDDTDGFFAELYGKVTGPGKGKAGSMHLSSPQHGLLATSAVVSTTIPLAVGSAFASRYRGSDEPTVVFFGDGAIEEGVFWESVNFACLHRLPILFVCEDNSLAIHSSVEERRGFASPEAVLKGFNCHLESGNGSDMEEVVRLTRGLLERMKLDLKPAFLHLSYFRFLEHVGPSEDFGAGYRQRPEGALLEDLDPVFLMRRRILASGVAQDELEALHNEVKARIDRSVSLAQAAEFPSASELLNDVMS